MASIAENYQTVIEDFQRACAAAGRSPDEVRLIAVSKFFPPAAVRRVYDLGQRLFGENRAQEMTAKAPELPADIQWHFIGRLQRNKVKYIIERAAMIHSVDSLALAEEISRQAGLRDRRAPALLEVNLGGEDTKAGFSPAGLRAGLEAIARLPGLSVQGLMTIGPYYENPEDARPLFRRLRELKETVSAWGIQGVEMRYLSMGMSHDFPVAIAEGADFVRVGTAIFGVRDRK
ncbi:MAG: YggS family pyridoxal phosphate-dependent enzyme [Peptococcaceae bacterium]|jgi:pyridoxal phosphate enzyme (YggS family)|nr:YggS family pyridoxal phosphate-dependent enzyme [Peptococcaceae bacterium]